MNYSVLIQHATLDYATYELREELSTLCFNIPDSNNSMSKFIFAIIEYCIETQNALFVRKSSEKIRYDRRISDKPKHFKSLCNITFNCNKLVEYYLTSISSTGTYESMLSP